ncbi:Hsp20/alpha crystallin family protein [Salidesulfovibrio onnuriiensis]|uniref:Hsp20/alpha crystallin family protein n=1 Tax=Salidesulfovibrio onnuriiensis TaxID=2583823 RepID=UPI0011C97CFC|nr:Hsp20/alpha crystallin family protein [Salidesulfovibrio onnuriiensis]
MAKLNWNPWMGLDLSADEQLRGDTAGRPAAGDHGGMAWAPAADMVEDEKRITIQVDVPGLSLEDIGVELRKGELQLYGRRRFEKDARKNVYHMLERTYGPFGRTFSLPRNVDQDSIRAHLKDGVLTIVISKSKPRRRTISVE